MKDRGSKFPGTAAKDVEAKPDGHVEGREKAKVDLAEGAEDAMRSLDVKSNGTV